MSTSTRIVAAVAPTAPLGIQSVALSSSSISISWFQVTGTLNGGSPVTGYSVYWKNQNNSTYTLAG